MRTTFLALVAVLVPALCAGPAAAKVFYARKEALAVALPGAESIAARDIFLTDAQKAEIDRQSGMPLDTSMLTLYTGVKGGHVVGYALFDTHVVRTHPETFVVSLDPAGRVTGLFVCAFHEPLDYLPSDRWLTQFKGKDPRQEMRVGNEIAGITGATLTARAVAGGVRRALAIFRVCVPPQPNPRVGE